MPKSVRRDQRKPTAPEVGTGGLFGPIRLAAEEPLRPASSPECVEALLLRSRTTRDCRSLESCPQVPGDVVARALERHRTEIGLPCSKNEIKTSWVAAAFGSVTL